MIDFLEANCAGLQEQVDEYHYSMEARAVSTIQAGIRGRGARREATVDLSVQRRYEQAAGGIQAGLRGKEARVAVAALIATAPLLKRNIPDRAKVELVVRQLLYIPEQPDREGGAVDPLQGGAAEGVVGRRAARLFGLVVGLPAASVRETHPEVAFLPLPVAVCSDYFRMS